LCTLVRVHERILPLALQLDAPSTRPVSPRAEQEMIHVSQLD
jgi:hypothetical protein